MKHYKALKIAIKPNNGTLLIFGFLFLLGTVYLVYNGGYAKDPLSVMFGAFVSVFLFSLYTIIEKREKRGINALKGEGKIDEAYEDLNSSNALRFGKLVFGDKYFFDCTKGAVYRYSDFRKLFSTSHRDTFLRKFHVLNAAFADGKSAELFAYTSDEASKKPLESFIDHISSRNPDIVIEEGLIEPKSEQE